MAVGGSRRSMFGEEDNAMPAYYSLIDSAWIPGMFPLLDRNGDPVCDCLEGDVPVVISAPHAGYTQFKAGDGNVRWGPPGASRLGSRVQDLEAPQLQCPQLSGTPWFNIGGFNDSAGDINTRHIAFGIIRRLIALGVRPYAVINRVLRYHVDLARPWELQHRWSNNGNLLTPAQVEAQDPDFKKDYHSRYHERLASFVQQVTSQGGWLFDIHGQNSIDQVVISTTAGWMARSDWVYLDGATSFFASLEAQALNPVALNRRPDGVDGAAVNFIPGLLHGATDPCTLSSNPPSKLDPVVPSPNRVHGVHVEIEGNQRIPMSGTREEQIKEMEKLGARVADAIYSFLDTHNFFAPARRQIAVRERDADEAWYALHG